MPFTPVDIRPGRVRERTGRKTDGIPVRHYPYLMPVRRGRKGYSTVAVKKQCVVGRLNAVPCNRREYHVSIPVYTLRLQRPGNFQSPGGRSIHLPHYHITTEIALPEDTCMALLRPGMVAEMVTTPLTVPASIVW